MALGGRVLVVDDVAGSREALAEDLRGELEVTQAGSFEEALTLLDQLDDLRAVVTDLSLGARDGLELLEAVQNKQPSAARILVSSSVVRALEGHILALGTVHGILWWPRERGALRTALREMLGPGGALTGQQN